jgi:hypothetical protein
MINPTLSNRYIGLTAPHVAVRALGDEADSDEIGDSRIVEGGHN